MVAFNSVVWFSVKVGFFTVVLSAFSDVITSLAENVSVSLFVPLSSYLI